MSRMAWVLGAFLILLTAGCTWSHPGVKPNDVRVQQELGQHSGDYYHNGRWYYVMNHEHGPGCGHYYYDGRWNLNPPVPGYTTHVDLCQARDAQAANNAPRENDQHPRQRGEYTYYKN